ncbi:hypothetical protein [Pseudonocardia sp. T1-2H]|uniref:hypothetical protein n=1 Tax=Pseudonocardia sp. T1-2H TaxID=3128899 RepID=UPI003101B02D
MDDDDILEAARTIRSVLAEMPGIDDPAAIDAALAAAVSEHDVQAARAELWRRPVMRRWAKEFVRLGVPPELVLEQTRSGAAPPPGHGGIVAAPRFRCPQGDYVWYRRTAVHAVPLCPSHRVRVVPDMGAVS